MRSISPTESQDSELAQASGEDVSHRNLHSYFVIQVLRWNALRQSFLQVRPGQGAAIFLAALPRLAPGCIALTSIENSEQDNLLSTCWTPSVDFVSPIPPGRHKPVAHS